MNSRFFATVLTCFALFFGAGCAVETPSSEVVSPERPSPSPETRPVTKKTSKVEMTMTAHDEATLLRVANICAQSRDTTYAVTFRETRTWNPSDQERVMEILGTLANVKVVFQL